MKWGKVFGVTRETHVTGTNASSHEGPGFHSTTEVHSIKVRDYITDPR